MSAPYTGMHRAAVNGHTSGRVTLPLQQRDNPYALLRQQEGEGENE